MRHGMPSGVLPTVTGGLLAREDRTTHIHLSDARVLASGVSPLPPGGMHWRGRLSEVSGWSFGHLGEPSLASVEDSDHTMQTSR